MTWSGNWEVPTQSLGLQTSLQQITRKKKHGFTTGFKQRKIGFNHQNLGVGFIKTIGIRGVAVRQQVTWCWASSSNQLSIVACLLIFLVSTRSNPMTDPWCWYIYTNIWGILMGSMLPYIYISIYRAAPWIRHGNDYFMIRPWMTFYPLVISYIAIEHGHLFRGFSH